MGTLDSREYDRLVARQFRPYSRGHREMYLKPIARLKGRQWRIVEAGFGIGYGLDEMVKAGIIERYIGYEPDLDSFQYVVRRHGARPNVVLANRAFSVPSVPAEHVFCIEVIEHVPMAMHAIFLRQLRASGRTLWLSTPDVETKPNEGVRRTGEWVEMLKAAGFDQVEVDRREWTHLYACR